MVIKMKKTETHQIVAGYRIFDQLFTNKAEAVALEDGKETVVERFMIVHNDDMGTVINCELGDIFTTEEEAVEELEWYGDIIEEEEATEEEIQEAADFNDWLVERLEMDKEAFTTVEEISKESLRICIEELGKGSKALGLQNWYMLNNEYYEYLKSKM